MRGTDFSGPFTDLNVLWFIPGNEKEIQFKWKDSNSKGKTNSWAISIAILLHR